MCDLQPHLTKEQLDNVPQGHLIGLFGFTGKLDFWSLVAFMGTITLMDFCEFIVAVI